MKEAAAGRAPQAEMEAHLEQTGEREAGNHRNGSSSRKVLADNGRIELAVPPDRHGRLEPQLAAGFAVGIGDPRVSEEHGVC